MASMDCSRFDELVQFYLDHDLDLPNRRAMERHERGCALCSDTLAAYRVLFDSLNSMEREPAPIWLEPVVVARISPCGVDARPRPEACATSQPHRAPRSGSHRTPRLGRASLRRERSRRLGRAALALVGVAGVLWIGSESTTRALLDALGHTLTWVYAVGAAVVAGVSWLQMVSLGELQQASTAVLRGCRLFLEAFGPHMLVYTSATMLMAMLLDRRGRSRLRRGQAH